MSCVVEARELTFAYDEADAVLDGVGFHLTSGWHGLVGDNGTGKSTLLRLIAGELAPTRGSLQVRPRGARVTLCGQGVDALTGSVTALGEREDGAARRLRATLRLDPDALARWGTLSPGERRRWMLGAALAEEPDVLLVDEPTNHLDVEGRGWVLEALARHRGVGVVVSHDRAVLDALPGVTLWVERRAVATHPGNYGAARAERERLAGERAALRERLRAESRRAEARLDEARRAREGATRQTSSGARMKGPRDHDGRSMGRKVVAGWAEQRHGRRVAEYRGEAERATEALAEVRVERAVGRDLFVDWEPAPRPRLGALFLPELSAGGRVLARDLAVTVARGERLRVAGPNGAGKSTLLRALAAAMDLPPERVLHVPQESDPGEDRALLASVRRLDPSLRGRVLSLVAALGTDPDDLLASPQPSPGSARKLRVALGLARRVWVALLDEPTNHLDLGAIERLEACLARYPGALVLVTHDDALAARTTARTLTLGA